ncbi:MAG: hypothetical protein QHJ73_17215, partial [Armatimonadota bacterium]|nr:hypothetical protein [Armatimonadota bacterium]
MGMKRLCRNTLGFLLLSATASTAVLAASVTVTVPAGAVWVDTGVYLEAGETFRVEARGEWSIALPDGRRCETDADGCLQVRYRGRPVGQLLGRVAGIPGPADMALGKAGEYRANAPGILYLESNHLWWLRNQHRGEITVSIHGGSPATDSLRARVREAALEAARSTALEYCNRVRRRLG